MIYYYKEKKIAVITELLTHQAESFILSEYLNWVSNFDIMFRESNSFLLLNGLQFRKRQ